MACRSKGFDSACVGVSPHRWEMCVSIFFSYDADNRKGWNFTLMKMFWRRSSKINIQLAQLSKMSRKRSYFLREAADWDNVAKGQPSSFGLSAFIISLKTALVYYKSVSFSDWFIRYVFPLRLDWKQNILHSFLLKQPAGCFFFPPLPLWRPTVPQKSSI